MLSTKYILLIISLSLPAMLQAQKIVNVSGATMWGSQYNIEYSVGEIAINTITTINKTVTQGLLQPYWSADSCLSFPHKHYFSNRMCTHDKIIKHIGFCHSERSLFNYNKDNFLIPFLLVIRRTNHFSRS